MWWPNAAPSRNGGQHHHQQAAAAAAAAEGRGYAPVDYIHALKNLPENNVLAVEPPARGRGEEELAAVRIRARVSHAQNLGGRGARNGENGEVPLRVT